MSVGFPCSLHMTICSVIPYTLNQPPSVARERLGQLLYQTESTEKSGSECCEMEVPSMSLLASRAACNSIVRCLQEASSKIRLDNADEHEIQLRRLIGRLFAGKARMELGGTAWG